MKRIITPFIICITCFCSFNGLSAQTQNRILSKTEMMDSLEATGLKIPPGIHRWEGETAPELVVDKWVNTPPEWHHVFFPDSAGSDKEFLILDFWLAECAPCRGVLQNLNAIAETYSNVQVVSVTSDAEEKVEAFLLKVPLSFPVGIDSSERVISNYKVELYPTTFIINKNRRIIWQDDLNPMEQLTVHSLPEILERRARGLRRTFTDIEKNEEVAYFFTLQENADNDFKGSSHQFSPFYIEVVNKDLATIMNDLMGISKARIIASDTGRLNKKYDLNLEALSEVTLGNNCNVAIQSFLPDEVGFSVDPVRVDTLFYTLKVVDRSLLNQCISDRKFAGTSTKHRQWGTQWSIKGAELSHLKKYLENKFNIMLETDGQDSIRYDFELDYESLEKSKSILSEKYGIELTETRGMTDMWKMEFKKQE